MPKLPAKEAHLRLAKIAIVQELFVRTADENYMTARWCAAEKLHTDFLWLATHALEKYMKAVLLMNGQTATGDGHETPALYERVKLIAKDLLPSMLDQPPKLDITHWTARTPEYFLERLYNNGNADNRYLIYGFVTQIEDLHMLDAMVFALRRLTCQLDGLYFYSDQPGAPTFTNRTLLLNQPNFMQSLGCPLDEAIFSKQPSPRQHAAMNLNFAFAPDGYAHTDMLVGTSARNPVLLRTIIEPLKSDDRKVAAHGVDVANWVLQSIKLPSWQKPTASAKASGTKKQPGVQQEIEAAVAAAKLKHKLP